MDLKITGTVKQVLEEQSGESRNGPWRKQEFILESEGKYPKPVCIAMWGENIDEFEIRPGERLTAYVDVASREYNGRWYTDVKAWKVERESGGGEGGDSPPEYGADEPFPDPTAAGDDLPF